MDINDNIEKISGYNFRVVVMAHTHVWVTHVMSARKQSVSAVILSVCAPPALRIDVVGSDPHPVLLSLSSSRSGPVLRRPAPHQSPSHPGNRVLGPRRASLQVIGTRVRTLRRQSAAARRAQSENTLASLLRGWMVAGGWTC